jgi:hypothetical protein
MRRADFEKELRQMATLTQAFEPAPEFQNVYKGAGRTAFLLVTAEATYAFRLGRLRRRLRPEWIVRHSALVADAYHSRETRRRQIVDALVLPLDKGTKVFPMCAGAGLAQYNCEIAAWEINEVRGARRPGAEPVDPFAPQRAGALALTAFEARDFSLAFLMYVQAIERLHEAFVVGECRVRRPSSGDEVLLDGLVAAFRAVRNAAPVDQPLPDDVEAALVHVVAQLREIAYAVDPPYRPPYGTAIRRLSFGTTSGK